MINPAQQKQLFLDDSAVNQITGVARRLHQPASHEAVIRPDQAQGQVAVQSRSAPQWNSEKQLWEWWYWGYYRVPPYGKYHASERSLSCYATSSDGIHWERPTLGLYEWRGSRQNNIAREPAEERTLYHIVRDEHDSDPQRRYKALFDVHDRYLGVSPDGFTWTMLDTPPIPSQDESHFLFDEGSGQFLAFVKQPTDWGRSVWLATSRDFQHFSEAQLVFHSDATDRANRKARIQQIIADSAYLAPPLVDGTDHIAQVYQMAVLPYAGLYVGFPVIFNPAGAIPPPHMNYTALNQVELTVSHDRLHWERVAERALFLPVDPHSDATYGWAQKLLCGTPHIHDKREIWIYYNALRFRGPRSLYKNIPDVYFEDQSALVLAKLRLDGFVSLDAERKGTIVTQPFHAQGGQLFVNAIANTGAVRAELLDAESGQSLPGFSVNEATALQGDHLRGRVGWQEQMTLPQDRAVLVRFHLDQAQLYAFWVESQV
ncbi:MAG: hypothetical protein HY328_19590 [Chloroflexi bacterium]|nr:hypothetical protein [Chloroflexota bacterium]